ncbi:MAG: toast rack family protein [Chloroflexi bacterium]|nr:toast rack family protein [Chloroflexota bacterium]
MDQRGFGFGGALILIGIVALLWNFDVLPDRFWPVAWSLWPVALVAVGAGLALSRVRAWLGSTAFLVVLIAGFGTAWGLAAVGQGPVLHRETITANRGEATSARLEVHVGAGSLTLDGAAPPGLLIAGNLESRAVDHAYSITESHQPGGRSVIELGSGPSREFSFWPGHDTSEDWSLHLTPHIPTEIRVEAGAADIDLDLRDLSLRNLQIEAGAADVDVVMPAAAGRTEASIEVGAASLRITVPEGVAARIEVDAGLSSIQIDEDRFPQASDDVYISPDFDRAANRVDITIDAGASHVEIR